jgi:hypothetical protein
LEDKAALWRTSALLTDDEGSKERKQTIDLLVNVNVITNFSRLSVKFSFLLSQMLLTVSDSEGNKKQEPE